MFALTTRLFILTLLVWLGISCAPAPEPGRDSRPTPAPDGQADPSLAVGHATIARIDPVTGEVLDVLPTGPDPLHLVTASGHIWIQNFGDGTLTHVDPESVSTSTPGTTGVAGIASDGRDVWVAHDDNLLTRIDGATGREEESFRLSTRRLYEPGRAGFVGIGGGSVWVTIPPSGAGRSEELWRIDHDDGEVRARIPIGTEANPPFAHGRFLWVITRSDEALTRIDMRTNTAERVDVDRYPWSLTFAGGSLWVAHHVNPKVVRLESETGGTAAELSFRTNPRGMTPAQGKLWVATEDGIYAIDPATDDVAPISDLGEFPADTGPIGIAYVEGALWVSIE